MSLLPQYEQRIVEAAAGAFAPLKRSQRAVRAALPTAAAVGALAVLLVALLTVFDEESQPDGSVASAVRNVDRATLDRSVRLTREPEPSKAGTLTTDELRRFVTGLQERLPYPPGFDDPRLDQILRTSNGPGDMGATSTPSDAQSQAEFRAWCIWQRYWLAARDSQAAEAVASATTVLEQAPRWPTLRGGSQDMPASIAKAARINDARPIQAFVEINCSF